MFRSAGLKLQRARPWIALGLAYLLAHQVVMFGLAARAMAGSVAATVSAVCGSDGATSEDDGSGGQPVHSHLLPCCAPSCAIFGASGLPPPTTPSLAPVRTLADTAVGAFTRDRVEIRRAQMVGSPRGPPLG